MKSGLVARFAQFRAGWGWMALLLLTLVIWFTWNLLPWLPHFDSGPEWAHLNLLLSIEASFTLPLLMMESKKSDEEMASKVRGILELLKEYENADQPSNH